MFRKKNILYKVEGSKKKGMGHVFRSYFLIKILKKKNNIIIFTEKKSESETFFKKKGFKIISYLKTDELKILKKIILTSKIDKFINDYILIKKKIYFYLIKHNLDAYFLDTKRIKARKKIYCINTFISSNQKHENYYEGLKYVIVDPNLNIKNKKNLSKKLNVVLHFGGTDEKKLNLKIANYLSNYKKLFVLKIILGPALKYNKKKIYDLEKNIKLKCKIYDYPKKLNPIYENSDIAVISGGNTLFNFCFLGKKNISISTTELERGSCKKMEKLNSTKYLGHYNKITKNKFLKLFNKVINSKIKNQKFSKINGLNEISKIINS